MGSSSSTNRSRNEHTARVLCDGTKGNGLFRSRTFEIIFQFARSRGPVFGIRQEILHTVFMVWSFDEQLGQISQHKTNYGASHFIVDDSDCVREAIKSLLASHSNKFLVCGEAVDGEEAVERAAAAMPVVILLDLSLPQVHGIVVAPKLREAIPSATIVIMSAQEPRLMRQFADSLAVEYFLTKSNLGTDLIASLEDVSRKKRSAV